MQLRALLHDDERMLKLTGTGGVQPEVGLQRNGHGHPWRHIHEGTTGPHSPVQSSKLMVAGRHQLHEVLADHVGILAVQSALHIGVHHAQGRDLFADVVVDQLGVILSAYTGQRFPLGLGDAQGVKRILDLLGDLGPLGAHLGVGADVGDDIIHVQPVDGGAPVGDGQLVVNF